MKIIIHSAWSNEGCNVLDTNRTHTVCTCRHLTNFAILMDVHAVPLSVGQDRALQIMTYIGCTISVVCLFLAILTFQLFRGLKVKISFVIFEILLNLVWVSSSFVLYQSESSDKESH